MLSKSVNVHVGMYSSVCGLSEQDTFELDFRHVFLSKSNGSRNTRTGTGNWLGLTYRADVLLEKKTQKHTE